MARWRGKKPSGSKAFVAAFSVSLSMRVGAWHGVPVHAHRVPSSLAIFLNVGGGESKKRLAAATSNCASKVFVWEIGFGVV